MDRLKLDGPSETALHRLQDTELSPMEEALFKAWTKANGIRKPDNADDPMDYRGIWKETGGQVLPWNQLERIATKRNAESRLTQTLADRMMATEQSGQDQMEQFRKEQQRDVAHQQRMEHAQMQLAKAPIDLRSQELKNQGKLIDVEAKKAAAEQQKHKTEQQFYTALTPKEPSFPSPEADPYPPEY